jgi:hypothetical protein
MIDGQSELSDSNVLDAGESLPGGSDQQVTADD